MCPTIRQGEHEGGQVLRDCLPSLEQILLQPQASETRYGLNLLEGDLPLNQGPNVSPGDMIKVRLAKVNPLDNTFRLEW